MQRDSAVTDRPRLVGLQDLPASPDITISVRQSFGIDSDLQVPAFSQTTEYVPEVERIVSQLPESARAGFLGRNVLRAFRLEA